MLQVFLAGNLGRDAELKDVGGTALASFSVAVTQRVKKEKVTTWISCSIWGARAPALASYLTKGSKVAVTGELTTRQGKDNGKTYLECRVSELTLLGSKGGESGDERPAPRAPSGGSGFGDSDYTGGSDDEIPF
jgi:single-strand DNA-binding protein